MKYDPPDDNSCDIVETLRYEARYTEIAISVQDECTEGYGLMCRAAADEIERLRKIVANNDEALEALRLAASALHANHNSNINFDEGYHESPMKSQTTAAIAFCESAIAKTGTAK